MKVVDTIDRISLWSGYIVRWLALVLSIVVLIEVFARYLLNSPTQWAFDVAMMIYTAMFLLGAAYVLLIKGHIRVDVILNMLPPRAQLILELVYYIVFFFPFVFVMVWYGTKVAILSTVAQEISNTSQWGEPIWPWRFVIPLGFLLFLIQGVGEFIRTIKSLKRN